jgi:inorganic pyrophosphatase
MLKPSFHRAPLPAWSRPSMSVVHRMMRWVKWETKKLELHKTTHRFALRQCCNSLVPYVVDFGVNL